MKADFGVAKIEASLGWGALLYLSPRFFFVVDLEFKAKVKAFGETLASVTVTATLEGPDEWRFDGKFSFSILWWDKTVPFHEHFGEVRQAETGTASLGQALQAELASPTTSRSRRPPANPVTLTSSGAAKLAHPVGRLAIRQRAVPLGLRVERLGTATWPAGRRRDRGHRRAQRRARPSFEQTTEQFSRGQFVALSDDEADGSDVRGVPGGCHRRVGRLCDGRRNGPRRGGWVRDGAVRPRAGWSRVEVDDGGAGVPRATDEEAREASKLGAAARSDRAEAALRVASPLAASSIGVDEPALASWARLVGRGGLAAGRRGNIAVTGRPGAAAASGCGPWSGSR